ncbi:MAG: hypothetical protein MUC53_14600 [Candidatus Contendobacter sp.]|jgi:hypothetical protein|nr:hypothetical protein [Candidatus Contendobacter sp.]
MSNVLGFATARKTSRGELVASWLNGGEIRVYDGDRPTDADTAISTQTNLVTFDVPDPSGTATNGVFVGEDISAATIIASGVAAWARVVDSSGAAIFDADVGLTGSGELITLDSLSLIQGSMVSVTSFTLTER